MAQNTIIGVDVGGSNIRIGKVVHDRITRREKQSITAKGTEQQVIDEVISAIDTVFDSDVTGIGVGVPSLVDVKEGVLYHVQNIPAWKRVPLRDILESRFNRPVYINNDANCFAAGEKHFGAGKDYQSFVGLILGTGFGAGIVIDNQLYLGVNCGAGEFGCIPYLDAMYESYCSGQYFTEKHHIRGEELNQMAQKGDPEALKIFSEYGKHVGNALKTIMLAVDPEAIILGGSISVCYPYFKDALQQSLNSFIYPHAVERLAIRTTTHPDIAVLGAAALYYDAQNHRNRRI